VRVVAAVMCCVVFERFAAHSDHVAGDSMILAEFPSARLIDPPPLEGIELGARFVEVVDAGSGHRCEIDFFVFSLSKRNRSFAHSDRDACFLDVKNRLLFCGDVLYPGFLYVRSFESFARGMRNVLSKMRGRFDYSLGAHCEMNQDGKLFKSGERLAELFLIVFKFSRL
jgi:hypothetical protein